MSVPNAECNGAKVSEKARAGTEREQERKLTRRGRKGGHGTQWNAQPFRHHEKCRKE